MLLDPLASLIRQYRAKGYSQKKIAEIAGVDRTTITHLESGKYQDLKLSTAATMARGFGVNLDALINKGHIALKKTEQPDDLYALVGRIMATLIEFGSEELYPGCTGCADGSCCHDTKEQFFRTLRDHCKRLCRSRGWKWKGAA